MSYRVKKAAFQIAVIAIVVGTLRLIFNDMIANDWLHGLSLFIGLLCGQFFARPFFERQWPQPMKGWAE